MILVIVVLVVAVVVMQLPDARVQPLERLAVGWQRQRVDGQVPELVQAAQKEFQRV